MKFGLKIFAIICAAVLVSQPAFATIPDDSILDFYDQNGIYYYNPSGNNDSCNSSLTKLSGNNMTEKVWNFFIEQGFNDAQTAGILGNARAETEVEPTHATNDTFWGLFQWAYGRKETLFNKLRAAGLGQYLTQEYWPHGSWKRIPADDLDRLLSIELEHTMSEKDFNWQEEIKKQNTPEAAAEVFLTLYERAVNGESEIIYYAPFIGVKYQHANRRRQYAREYYDMYSGHGNVTPGNTVTSENGQDLTIIGDSITVGSTNAILEKFSDLSATDIYAVNGRHWNEGISEAKSRTLKKNVIFALGTNSPNLQEVDVLNAINAIGTDHNIVFVTNYSQKDPAMHDSNNAIFVSLAKNNSNIYLADWESAVSEKSSEYMSDHLHPNAEGQKLFANTLYTALNGGTDANGCSVSGEFAELVKAYAWPDYHKGPYTQRTTAYAEAVTRSLSEGRYVGGSVNNIPGIDCGGFVTILVQNSGIEPNYNDFQRNTTGQEEWVNSHHWTLLNASKNTPVDTSILQPGDVAFSTGHTFIYVGEIAGFNSVIASASYGAAHARAPMAGHEGLITNLGVYVRWYRNPAYSASNTLDYKTNLLNAR